MKVVFWHSEKPRERILGEAFIDGIKRHGETGELRPLCDAGEVDTGFDVACMVGVKSREIFKAHARAGIPVVYLDKGYCRQKSEALTRSWEYWRVSVGAHHPTRYLMKYRMPTDRWDSLGLNILPWRKKGAHIVLAGSSEKFHAFYGLSHPTRFAEKTIARLHKVTSREIFYRPKPSWSGAEPIQGSTYSGNSQPIAAALAGAHALVTHGSNACFEAMLFGIPSVILGDAVAKPLSSTDLGAIEKPRLAGDAERKQWFANLAYQQWTLPEMAKGDAWEIMRPFVYE